MAEAEVLWERWDDMWYFVFRRYIFHVVQQGDTFFNLARRYGVDVNEIIQLNPCAVPENLQIGQIVIIPCPRRPRRDDPAGFYTEK
ncbi:MAG: LysM peptidoglycan-binding domain-containing protein [Clostridia bacterium]|nr:LysM peptidoglycan-binding domain-containing protein [Clostridia bacterium]